jgi:hypothetical protein
MQVHSGLTKSPNANQEPWRYKSALVNSHPYLFDRDQVLTKPICEEIRKLKVLIHTPRIQNFLFKIRCSFQRVPMHFSNRP